MSKEPEKETPIVAYLHGHGRDTTGRLVDEVLAFDNQQLETHHDFIQWLFPLRAPSMAVPGSPVLTHADIETIKTDESIQAVLTQAWKRMRRFYDETDHWLVYHDHNHLRITRILLCTRLLTGPDTAHAFYTATMIRVTEIGDKVSPASQKFWRDALTEPSTDI